MGLIRLFSRKKSNMGFRETKVYFDGSHYIAIPHTERKIRYRPKPKEEEITVVEKESSAANSVVEPFLAVECDEVVSDEQVKEDHSDAPQMASEPLKTERRMTRKELFEELYGKYIDLPTRERHFKIMDGMEPHFDTVEELKWYVDLGFDRKARNLRERRVRMIRKAYLAGINYFCTFTYDDKKHTEDSFRKGLQTFFRNLCYRKGWKYMGVWERSPENKRLHFHGLFAIPENAMVGMLFEKTDYSFKTRRKQTTVQNTYFNENFGRSDFEQIFPTENTLENELSYLMKYIEKDGEKIVYSKGFY